MNLNDDTKKYVDKKEGLDQCISIDRACSLPSLREFRDTDVDEGLCLGKDRRDGFIHSDVSLSENELNVNAFAEHGNIDDSTRDSASEGYLSLASNCSSQSSPRSSSQTSPIGDGREFITDVHETNKHFSSDELQPELDGITQEQCPAIHRCQSDGFSDARDREEMEEIDGKYLSGNNNLQERAGVEENLSDRMVFDLSEQCKANAREETSTFMKPPASEMLVNMNENRSDSDVNKDVDRKMTMMLNSSALFKRKMSTIEELKEDTPSPRSTMNIDAEFKLALKSLDMKNAKDLCEEDDPDKNDVYSDSYADENCKGPMEFSVGIEQSLSPIVKSATEVNSVMNQNFIDGVDEFLANEKLFDIDLDECDVPNEHRKSLEIKLDNLRDFVSNILEERKGLEKDRTMLKEVLQFVNAQEPVEDRDDQVAVDLATVDKCTAKEISEISDAVRRCNADLDELRKEEHCRYVEEDCSKRGEDGEGDKENASNMTFEYEELMMNLEEALMENIGLKNENIKLIGINEDLQNRIEELLTEEEEMQYKMNEETLKLMDESQRQRDENSVLKSNFNRVLKDYNSLENDFKDFEIKYEDLLSEREFLLTQLSIKNESYIASKEQCEILTEELGELKNKAENCGPKQDKVWSRADWEEWTVLQTKLSATEKALFDSRKQKSQLMSELKRMKGFLEASKDKILDAEKAMTGLELTLEKAQENNQVLHSENEGLRMKLLQYEMNLLEKCHVSKQTVCEDKSTDTSEISFEDGAKNLSMEAGADMMAGARCGANPREIVNAIVMRSGFTDGHETVVSSKNEATNTDDSQADVFAGCQYQNAFQEVGGSGVSGSNDEVKTLVTEIEYPCASDELLGAYNASPSKLSKKSKLQQQKSSRKVCLPLKGLLPSVVQSILNAKAKKRMVNEEKLQRVDQKDASMNMSFATCQDHTPLVVKRQSCLENTTKDEVLQ
eukprot:gene14006-15464_t